MTDGKAGEDFTCAQCGGEFTRIVDDQEAVDEMEALFDTRDTSDAELVCDDCFKEIMAHVRRMSN